MVAGAIDGIDGRLARLLKTTSRFGAEFDSLSDFLCFGVAPALVLYLWTLHDVRSLDEPRLFLIGYGPSQSTVGANRAGRDAVRAILADPRP